MTNTSYRPLGMRTTDTDDSFHQHSCADCGEGIDCYAEYDRDCKEPLCATCIESDRVAHENFINGNAYPSSAGIRGAQ